MTISVVGLGKIGLPLAVQFAGTSVSATVCVATDSPLYVVVPPFAGMERLWPPSTVTV